MDREHLVHFGEVDADAAMERQDVSFERTAGAERHDRHAMPAAGFDDRDDLGGVVGPDDGIGQHVREMRLVVAVMRANRLGGRKPRTEAGAELVGECGGQWLACRGVGQIHAGLLVIGRLVPYAIIALVTDPSNLRDHPLHFSRHAARSSS